jgi:hypothetical protein
MTLVASVLLYAYGKCGERQLLGNCCLTSVLFVHIERVTKREHVCYRSARCFRLLRAYSMRMSGDWFAQCSLHWSVLKI